MWINMDILIENRQDVICFFGDSSINKKHVFITALVGTTGRDQHMAIHHHHHLLSHLMDQSE